MTVLAALIAGLLAGAAFARGLSGRLQRAALAGLAAAGLGAVAAALAGDEALAGIALGIAAAAALTRLDRAGRGPGPAAVALLGLLGLRLGVALGGWLPLAPDEAQYWDWSRSPDLAYLSKPGGIAWLLHAWTWLAGDGLAGLRLLGLGLAGAALALAWRAARTATGDPALAWGATALAAVLPLHACAAGLVTTDVPLLLCWAAFLAVLLRTPAAGGAAAWWHGPALGGLLALGLNAKYAMLYAPLAVAAAAGLPQVRAWLRSPAPWIALGLGLTGLIPVLLWNREHGQLGLLHLAGQAGAGHGFALRPERLPEYVAGQLAVGFPVSLLLPWAAVWAWRDRLARPAAWILACAALVPLGVLLLASIQTKVQPNWAALAWIPAAILAAWWLRDAATPRTRRLAVAGCALAAVVAIAVAAAPLVRARWPALPPSVPERKLAGYDEIAEVVDGLLATQPERSAVLTAEYDLAAELAWHLRHRPRPLCADFGRRASQYDLWPGLSAGERGWDVVFVRELDSDDALEGDLRSRLPAGLGADFAACDQPRLVRVLRGGRTWRTFLAVRLRGFDGSLDSARRR